MCLGRCVSEAVSIVFTSRCLLLLIFKCLSYVLGKSPLSGVSFANIPPSPPVCGLSSNSPAIILSFTENLNFSEAQLLNDSFMDRIFGVVSKETSPRPRSPWFSPMLSSGTCALRSVICSESALWRPYGLRLSPSCCWTSAVPASLVKENVCVPWLVFAVVKAQLLCSRGLSAPSHGSTSLLPPTPHGVDYCSFAAGLAAGRVRAPSSLFGTTWALPGLLSP